MEIVLRYSFMYSLGINSLFPLTKPGKNIIYKIFLSRNEEAYLNINAAMIGCKLAILRLGLTITMARKSHTLYPSEDQ